MYTSFALVITDLLEVYFTVKRRVYIMLFSPLYFFFSFDVVYEKKCNQFQTCKCMIWTIKFQVFCMFLSFHDNKTEKKEKKNVVSQIYLRCGETEIKTWVT